MNTSLPSLYAPKTQEDFIGPAAKVAGLLQRAVRDALAVGAVTRDAVLAVQLLALRARQGDGGDGQGNGCVLFHDCLHAMATIDAMPSSKTMTR